MTKEEQEDFSKLFQTYHDDTFIRQFRKVLARRLEDFHQPKPSDYDNPSWAYLQAHRNGQEEMLLEVIKLIGEQNK